VDINAQMAALEVSYDRDWIRYKASFFYASGDDKAEDGTATGFDTIFDNPQFAGGQFSYWQRQQIKLFGVELTNRFSLVPDLRATKTEGQQNFVNPGLQLVNFGMDAEVTQKLRLIGNVNFLWFNQTEVLKTFVFQERIANNIGADLSLGGEYRPRLNNNIVIIVLFHRICKKDGRNNTRTPPPHRSRNNNSNSSTSSNKTSSNLV
jgi:hypothetical protein